MPTTAITNLPWRGAETVDAARTAIAQQQALELQFPAGYHHAVYARFQPSGGAALLDVRGGAELLQRFAQIEGLDALAALEPDAAQAHAAVRVLSPAPAVVITFQTHTGEDA